ncbi:UPF0104 family protein [Marinobacter sp. R17]|uniref:lysylphosphatidylglycerol synthase transmembrane domain-containing protein n=1 Tax=Marinobacter sp. R17 TaxID=2484250 RepID=UPI000F4D040E|nr:lysylphosphatidylglycerol synthase transmembrane domain-containing protein [Marinobacter sp. R17]ROT99606.1 UPF0104 family protein [Marinobacter sp. R17]
MRRWPVWLRWGWTLAVLVAALLAFDSAQVLSRLGRLSASGLIAVLALALLQVVLSAGRWRYTARLLGLPLPWSEAVREYFLASFINQVMPGGVLGDANRALRHGRSTQQSLSALNAVLIERLAGQIVLAGLAILAWWWLMPGDVVARMMEGLQLPGWSLVLAAVMIGLLVACLWSRLAFAIRSFLSALHFALLRPRVLLVQLGVSLPIILCYVGVFLILARDLGMSMPVSLLIPGALALLLAMVLPITVAGWGVRESVAGILWGLMGYSPADGLALSVAYGLVFLVASAPGLVWLWPIRRAVA